MICPRASSDGLLERAPRPSGRSRWAITSVSVSEAKRAPVGDERLAQRARVVDDAVVHDGDRVRRVEACGWALPRWARRGWPIGCGRCRCARQPLRQRGLEFANPADPADHRVPDGPSTATRPSRSRGTRAGQALDEERRGLLPADVADDSAHATLSLSVDDPAQLPLGELAARRRAGRRSSAAISPKISVLRLP